jgi:hypothetical protein
MAASRTFPLALDLMAYAIDSQSFARKILYRGHITNININIVACRPVDRQRPRKSSYTTAVVK